MKNNEEDRKVKCRCQKCGHIGDNFPHEIGDEGEFVRYCPVLWCHSRDIFPYPASEKDTKKDLITVPKDTIK